jgi:hypothetical protein
MKSCFAFSLRAIFPWEFLATPGAALWGDACEPRELWPPPPLASQTPENAIATAQAIAARIFTGAGDCPVTRRPPELANANDISEYAFALVRHNCDDNDGSARLAYRLASFFSNASIRLSRMVG